MEAPSRKARFVPDAQQNLCQCVKRLEEQCGISSAASTLTADPESLFDSQEAGRIAYTIAILLMFSLVIVLLMIRSIRRSNSAVEVNQMDALLDAMRFREELDLQERQRRRLLKAKTKVSAWLTKTHGVPGVPKGWRSSPQLIQPRKFTSSTISDIPEIVVTDDGIGGIQRAHTPCLSLIYDFGEPHSKKSSICSEMSQSLDAFRSSRGSMSLDRDMPPRLSIEETQSLSFDTE